MESVAILGGKGGSTTTASSHLVCLGAYLHGIPAAYALTDPQRKVRGEGVSLCGSGWTAPGTAGADPRFKPQQY
jgi:hypothetical protein